ncbi:MAG: penicillin-binding transpeptidase domain-containing protein [Candidatus Taylorbacteria bacterium]|nr:penicillin-binding transpeptidase domain-containing protein [Candidatus Taylorbacteria bacterium]
MTRGREIDPDEILLDSSNIPKYDQSQFEGRLEKPISRGALIGVGVFFALILVIFLGQAINLQVVQGSEYLKRSQNNLLNPVPIFASRGAVFDRNEMPLTWNAPGKNEGEDAIPQRKYIDLPGLSHVLGYVQYPSKDKNGFYYRDDFEGVDGIEKYFNERLTGENGSRLVETDARGGIVSENVVRPPERGETITLSIDSRVQSGLYESIKAIASEYDFKGGAGIIMDVRNGEVLAVTSYPEYSPQIMSDRTDQVKVKAQLNNPNLLFLDRAVGGLYTPGSIIKPYVAMGALNENIIDASTVIMTTGSVEVPNPYDPEVINVFRDWKNHGPLDMRHAIAVSSDAYFYIIGGGYKDQKGLGIANIDKYLRMFGLGEAVPESFFTGPNGVISSPAWKQATFKESWYLGDTYHSVIGQYGTQVTPVQIVRAVAALANDGKLLVPSIIKNQTPQIERTIDLPQKYFNIIHEGMRLSVKLGTSVALNKPFVEIAGKSGTAELGSLKANVNSWITGFWPYTDPHYAFVVILEHGSVHNLIGAAAVMSNQLEWMNKNTPEYFK